MAGITRRGLGFLAPGLLTPALLAGCARIPPMAAEGTTPGARALLEGSAAAHGLAALSSLRDVSVRYEGEWAPIIGRLQPALVDEGHRGASEERLLLRDGVVAQAHAGAAGRKQVVRRWAPLSQGGVRVWFGGVGAPAAERREMSAAGWREALDAERRGAAALVADGYALFLLGPMLLAGRWGAERAVVAQSAGVERIGVEGQSVPCDVLRVRVSPGLGFSAAEEMVLFIEEGTGLMRRVRFSLEGMEGTRGAVAEVDCSGHLRAHGVAWPTRFHERLLRPLPLRVHDWRLTGLDVDRGMTLAEVEGAGFAGRAVAPAAVLVPVIPPTGGGR